ncbi:hypothetical protein [Adhaeribacter aquaticus]|uniref:hypothetical protein n=1 Tax=Adhaeribacter aquaticus TaxID=299567 RepID=UPI0003FF6741|nr:hypothetical protein [Adhaeribacter aquaticus]
MKQSRNVTANSIAQDYARGWEIAQREYQRQLQQTQLATKTKNNLLSDNTGKTYSL